MSTTDNGWFASPFLRTRPFVIDGVEFPAGIADNDDVELVLRYVLQKVADTVEAPHDGWCWGFGFRPNRNDPNSLSRHSGGIAVDLNAPTNPNGVPTVRTWTQAQINAIHAVLDDLDEACGEPIGSRVLRWGGDYEGTPDSMHFEVNRSPAELRTCAARLRTYLEAHMPLNDTDRGDIRQIVREEMASALADLAKNGGAIIKVDHDGDPKTAKISLERELRQMDDN